MGTTTELPLHQSVQEYMEKIGAGGCKRIYATTDKPEVPLRKLADMEKYESFSIPERVGGGFSVLTPVGLLPIAVAGIRHR